MAVSVRGSRILGPSRSRLPSGQLRAPGRTFADDPRPTIAELAGAPLDFARGHHDLPCLPPADPEDWFPVGSTGETFQRALAAVKARCQPCPVRRACRDYAVDNHMAGVWGATDEDERAAMRRTA